MYQAQTKSVQKQAQRPMAERKTKTDIAKTIQEKNDVILYLLLKQHKVLKTNKKMPPKNLLTKNIIYP